MCDAGWFYHGKLTKEEIFEQIDYLVKKRFPNGRIDCEKFKIQFARLGEPSFNPAVLDVLKELPLRYDAPGLMPCISTVAPCGCEGFFEELMEIKKKFYNKGNFQLQFSIHSTDSTTRDRVIPIRKWDFETISRYGERFFENGDRKITLNFAAIKNSPIDPLVIKKSFSPERFILKFTPVNPTEKVKTYGLKSYIDPYKPDVGDLFKKLNSYGFETLLSIGDLEENNIGSNCGQIIHRGEKQLWKIKP
jgi:23S rRNA (adenine2503-C2)-methyltransferase